MSDRQATRGAGDEASLPDGDGAFIGVDMRRDPVQLGAGLLSFARNARFDRQVAETRLGVGLLRWGNAYGTAFPLVFPLVFSELVGFTEVFGGGVFSDPSGTEWVLIAVADGVFIGREGFPMVKLGLPLGEAITETCFFKQALDEVYLFRTVRHRTLVWRKEYLQAPDWFPPWDYLEAELVDGTAQIPDAATAEVMSDRMFVPIGRDEFVSSDLLNFARYGLATNRHRAGAGDAERLVRLYPFGNTTLAAFCTRGIYLFLGVTGDLSQMYRDELTRELGLVAPLSVATVGSDVFFLSDTGVYTLKQVLDNRLQGSARPVSEPIQPLIARIQWRHVAGAVAAYWNNKYYLAVPLDASSRNNAVLVYDVLNGAWAGYDDGPSIEPKAWIKATVRGRQRLLMVDYEGLVYLWEEHYQDEGSGGFVEIELELLTRGYLCGSPEEKQYGRVLMDLETWRPRYSVAAEAPGVNV